MTLRDKPTIQKNLNVASLSDLQDLQSENSSFLWGLLSKGNRRSLMKFNIEAHCFPRRNEFFSPHFEESGSIYKQFSAFWSFILGWKKCFWDPSVISFTFGPISTQHVLLTNVARPLDTNLWWKVEILFLGKVLFFASISKFSIERNLHFSMHTLSTGILSVSGFNSANFFFCAERVIIDVSAHLGCTCTLTTLKWDWRKLLGQQRNHIWTQMLFSSSCF